MISGRTIQLAAHEGLTPSPWAPTVAAPAAAATVGVSGLPSSSTSFPSPLEDGEGAVCPAGHSCGCPTHAMWQRGNVEREKSHCPSSRGTLTAWGPRVPGACGPWGVWTPAALE